MPGYRVTFSLPLHVISGSPEDAADDAFDKLISLVHDRCLTFDSFDKEVTLLDNRTAQQEMWWAVECAACHGIFDEDDMRERDAKHYCESCCEKEEA